MERALPQGITPHPTHIAVWHSSFVKFIPIPMFHIVLDTTTIQEHTPTHISHVCYTLLYRVSYVPLISIMRKIYPVYNVIKTLSRQQFNRFESFQSLISGSLNLPRIPSFARRFPNTHPHRLPASPSPPPPPPPSPPPPPPPPPTAIHNLLSRIIISGGVKKWSRRRMI